MIVPKPQSFAELVGFSSAPVMARQGDFQETHGTTVLALRYNEGVLVLADRRATMGNLIMFDQAEKIVPLDETTVVAISGSFARSIEICRLLQHSFRYYRRMHLQEMSLDGKLQEISRALANNMPMVMQGIGVFLPILATFNREDGTFGVYFFDTAGARFQSGNYAAAGSGSERIRGIFEFLSRTIGAWEHRTLDEVMLDGLRMLDIAADLDSATGGFTKRPPAGIALTKTGPEPISDYKMKVAIDAILAADRASQS